VEEEKILEYFEKHPESVLFPLVAEIKLNSGNALEAVEICKTGIQRYPDKAIGHYILSRALRESGNLEEAIEELKKTVTCDPDFLQAYYDLLEIGGNRLTEEEKMTFKNRISFLNPLEEEIHIEKREIKPESEPIEKSPKETFTEAIEPQEPEQGGEEKEKIEEIFEEPIEAEEPPFAIVGSEEVPEEEAHLGPLEKEEKTEMPETTEETPTAEAEAGSAAKLKDMFEKLKTKPLEELRKESWDLESTEAEEKEELPTKPEYPEEELKEEAFKEPHLETEEVGEKPSEEFQELEVPIPTFTLVEILKKQKLYDQALEVLKVLEKRRKDLEKVRKYREEILKLKSENK